MKAAIIGGGVIGGGWAARFLLNGWDVDVFDPDPQAQRKIAEVLANARKSLPAIYDTTLPTEGRLQFKSHLHEAVKGANWIQESVPEQLEIKHRVHAEITENAPQNALIGSSTSGFKPSQLREKGARVFVAHPFNPVYLLPLVELVGAPDAAENTLKTLGFYPLMIHKEIDAHIADRLLESVWREALWLVSDGIATTAEIDESIRMGFGLRWAQMGLFETYRIAGGEAGMRHFMSQFGPALQWPWSKLTQVPEFNDELVNLIAEQSDAQSGHLSVRELERIRDKNLIGFLRHLKSMGWGAGEIVAEHEAHLKANSTPSQTRQVLPNWIDYNGHMTEFRYAQVFAEAGDEFLFKMGFDPALASTSGTFYTVESHIQYLGELTEGDAFQVEPRVLFADPRKLHLYQEIRKPNGDISAIGEHFYLYVDGQTRRSSQMPDGILENLNAIFKAQKHEPWPASAGKVGKK